MRSIWRDEGALEETDESQADHLCRPNVQPDSARGAFAMPLTLLVLLLPRGQMSSWRHRSSARFPTRRGAATGKPSTMRTLTARTKMVRPSPGAAPHPRACPRPSPVHPRTKGPAHTRPDATPHPRACPSPTQPRCNPAHKGLPSSHGLGSAARPSSSPPTHLFSNAALDSHDPCTCLPWPLRL